MYDFVKDRNKANVKYVKGDITYLETAISPFGMKYVKTKPDDTKADNLLSLPACKYSFGIT